MQECTPQEPTRYYCVDQAGLIQFGPHQRDEAEKLAAFYGLRVVTSEEGATAAFVRLELPEAFFRPAHCAGRKKRMERACTSKRRSLPRCS